MSILPFVSLVAAMFLAESRGEQPAGAAVEPTERSGEQLIASPEPDWPQWRGPRRDGICPPQDLLPAWPEDGPRLLWKFDGLGTGWSSPIVVGPRVYITGDRENDLVIYALDRQGALQWRAANGESWTGPYPGARACCAYSAACLYHMNAHGRVACLDAASGKELWAVQALERFGGKEITWGLSECLLVDGPRVIVTPGGAKALMATLDSQDGHTVWTTAPPGDDCASHASPILFQLAGRRLIASCSSVHGFGVDADTGELLWTVPLKNPHGVNAATPIYGLGCIYYVTPYSEEGRLYRLDAAGRGLTAPHAWTSPLDTVTGSGVLVDDVLYASGYRRCKWWLAVDWNSGRTIGEFKNLTTGAAIYACERLYVLDERGTVALLEPGPGGLKVAGQFRLPIGRVADAWAHPVLVDGHLYLRYHDTLWCYDVRRMP